MQSLHRNKKSKKVGIYIVLIFLLIIADPFHLITKVRSGLMIILSPLSRVGYGIGTKYDAFVHVTIEIGDLYEQNQKLREEHQQLEARSAQCGDVEKENEMLRSELKLLPRAEYTLVGADIIMRDSLGGNQWATINRGRKDGVAEDMAVIVGEHIFVGYIDMVDENTSRIRFLTHPDSVINVVGEKSGAEAIMRGNHGLSATIEDIKKNDHVENSEMFITSAIGTQFPRGLSVGRVQNITMSEDQLFQQANITPVVSFGDIRVVFIVTK